MINLLNVAISWATIVPGSQLAVRAPRLIASRKAAPYVPWRPHWAVPHRRASFRIGLNKAEEIGWRATSLTVRRLKHATISSPGSRKAGKRAALLAGDPR